MELDWLKKVRDAPAMMRLEWIDGAAMLPLVPQCARANVARSMVYSRRHPHAVPAEDLELSAELIHGEGVAEIDLLHRLALDQHACLQMASQPQGTKNPPK